MQELRKIWQHGGSLCITLPPAFIKVLHLVPADVTLLVLGSKGEITMRKVTVDAEKMELKPDAEFRGNFPYNPVGISPRTEQPD